MAWSEYPGIDGLFWGNVMATLGAVPLLVYYSLVVYNSYYYNDDDDGGSAANFAIASIVAIVIVTIGLIVVTYYSTPTRIYYGLFYGGNPHNSPPEGFFQRHMGTGFLLGASIMTLSFIPYLAVGIWYLEDEEWYDGVIYTIGSLLYLALMLLCQWALLPDIGAHPEHGVMGKFLQTSCGRFICCAKKEKKKKRFVAPPFLGLGVGGSGSNNSSARQNTSANSNRARNTTSPYGTVGTSPVPSTSSASAAQPQSNNENDEEEIEIESSPAIWSDQWLIEQMGSDLMFSSLLGLILFIYWIIDVLMDLSSDSTSAESWANFASIIIFILSLYYYAKGSLTLEAELMYLGKDLNQTPAENTRLVPYEESSSRTNYSVII